MLVNQADYLLQRTCFNIFFPNFKVGDGTTSVIVLAGEMLAVAEQFLEQKMHPTVIIKAYRQALEDMIAILQDKIR